MMLAGWGAHSADACHRHPRGRPRGHPRPRPPAEAAGWAGKRAEVLARLGGPTG